MIYPLYNNDKLFMTFVVIIIFSFVGLKVIAQDQSNHSNYRKTLAMSTLPTKITNNAHINIKQKASISNESLLFLYPESEILSKEKNWEAYINKKYAGKSVVNVTRGMAHIKYTQNNSYGKMQFNIIELDRNINKNLVIEPALSGSNLDIKDSVKNVAIKAKALAGINGGFYKTDTGYSLGTIVINNEIVSGPIFNRVSLGINSDSFNMKRINFYGSVDYENSSVKIDNINVPRMLCTQVIIYSDKWGKYSPKTPKYGIQFAIKNGKIIKTSEQPMAIPKDGYVLVGPESKLSKLKNKKIVKINYSLDSDFKYSNVISGGPFLVKEGEIYIDTASQKLTSIDGYNPRTAIGYTKDNKLILVTIDGRQKSSKGATLEQLANIMKTLDCYYAMNLDGGSSTQMFVDKKIVNNPLIAGGAKVSNALIVKLKED